MRLLAIDPGGTTGWAFFEGTSLKSFGSVKMEDFYDWLENLSADLYVCEDYIIDNRPKSGFNHQFNKGETLQLIGAIKAHCARHKIKLVMQQRSIKKPAAGMMFGKPYKDNQKDKQHQYDAILHGGYYLMTKCKAKPADFRTT